MWYRTGVICTECLLIFGFIFGSYIFQGLNTLRTLKKQAIPLHSSAYLGIVTRRIYEIQYKYNEQWSSTPLSRVQKVKTY